MAKKSPITLYGISQSTCTQRVIATLTEKGLSFTLQSIDFFGGEHKTPKYLQDKHPFGVIPVLIDENGFKVYESRAICRYLEMKYKGKGTELIPTKDPKAQGLFEQAASTEISYFDPYASGIVAERVLKKMKGQGEADEAKVASHKAELNKSLDVYEKILSQQPYLAGEKFTLADLFHLPYGTWLVKIGEGDLFESRPHVKDWWTRITSRISWKTAQAME
ncbi:unnamed protein product [Adineta ricciae]|uniref:glutathione transferase n=1 Tax=Adineta ricciae TaxID=249248 RepID=A0A815DYF0_ADIRI|nr:unnamed protein product [Adineta ricciae]CAF1304272.1 unnamed protein product [Adineta ricciae]